MFHSIFKKTNPSEEPSAKDARSERELLPLVSVRTFIAKDTPPSVPLTESLLEQASPPSSADAQDPAELQPLVPKKPTDPVALPLKSSLEKCSKCLAREQPLVSGDDSMRLGREQLASDDDALWRARAHDERVFMARGLFLGLAQASIMFSGIAFLNRFVSDESQFYDIQVRVGIISAGIAAFFLAVWYVLVRFERINYEETFLSAPLPKNPDIEMNMMGQNPESAPENRSDSEVTLIL